MSYEGTPINTTLIVTMMKYASVSVGISAKPTNTLPTGRPYQACNTASVKALTRVPTANAMLNRFQFIVLASRISSHNNATACNQNPQNVY